MRHAAVSIRAPTPFAIIAASVSTPMHSSTNCCSVIASSFATDSAGTLSPNPMNVFRTAFSTIDRSMSPAALRGWILYTASNPSLPGIGNSSGSSFASVAASNVGITLSTPVLRIGKARHPPRRTGGVGPIVTGTAPDRCSRRRGGVKLLRLDGPIHCRRTIGDRCALIDRGRLTRGDRCLGRLVNRRIVRCRGRLTDRR